MKEAVIQQDIRLALGMRDDVFLFRINVGKFRPLELVDELIRSVFDIIKEWSDENDVKLDRMQCMGAIVAMSRMCMSTLMEYPSEGGSVQ